MFHFTIFLLNLLFLFTLCFLYQTVFLNLDLISPPFSFLSFFLFSSNRQLMPFQWKIVWRVFCKPSWNNKLNVSLVLHWIKCFNICFENCYCLDCKLQVSQNLVLNKFLKCSRRRKLNKFSKRNVWRSSKNSSHQPLQSADMDRCVIFSNETIRATSDIMVRPWGWKFL